MEAHFCKLIEHHIDDMVAVAEMVVEADGHAVAQARQANGILQRGDEFAHVLHIPQQDVPDYIRSRMEREA